MNFINLAANSAQRVTLKIFADWHVRGRENVPPSGPLIIVANHQSAIDPTFLCTGLPRKLRFLAKEELFRFPIMSFLLRQYGAAPLRRGRADMTAYRWALDHLEQGNAIAMFPEGTRNLGGMKKANSGVARLALRSQAAIIPVGITGSERFKSVARIFNPTGEITVNIGPPFSLPRIEGHPSSDVLTSLTDMVMRRVAELLPPRYQGVYRIDRVHTIENKAATARTTETDPSY